MEARFDDPDCNAALDVCDSLTSRARQTERIQSVDLGPAEDTLLDLVERAPADEFHERMFPEVSARRKGDFMEAAHLAGELLRRPWTELVCPLPDLMRGEDPAAPRDSNTGGATSHPVHGTGLHRLESCEVYRSAGLLQAPGYSEHEEFREHWTTADPRRFAELSQGGGGMDWIKANCFGDVTDQGWALVNALREASRYMRDRETAFERCAEVGLHLVDHKFGEWMTFSHPFGEGVFTLHFGHAGKGRCYQPLMIMCDGFSLAYGRIQHSIEGERIRGPVARVQVTSNSFMRHGEDGVFLALAKLCKSFGVRVDYMTSGRLDVCADLPDMTVDEFEQEWRKGQFVSRARPSKKSSGGPCFHWGLPDQDGELHCESMIVQSGCCRLTIYDKLKEAKKDQTGEKLGLLVKNRWGYEPKSAVRVEFQFNMGKNRSKKYRSFRELFIGMSDLIGWATNVWCRFVRGLKDRTHTSRAGYADCWLRVLHAFAWWAGRLGERPAPVRVQAAPAWQLMKQSWGTMATALGRSGIEPEDDFTAWEIMASYQGANSMAALCRQRAIEAMTQKGIEMRYMQSVGGGPARGLGGYRGAPLGGVFALESDGHG